jgi:RecA-family ATPase
MTHDNGVDGSISPLIRDALESHARVMSGRAPNANSRKLLDFAAQEVFRVLRRDAVSHPERSDVNHQGAVDRLQEIAELGEIGPDTAQQILANARRKADMPKVAPWWREPAEIPPRQFLYDRHYVRGAVGATIAAGGRGKTTGAIFEAVSMAVGKDLQTGEDLPCGPLRVVLWNGEEDQDELDRRVCAVCQHYRVARADLGDRLFVVSIRDEPMRLAVMEDGSAKIVDDVRFRMARFISDNRIDVFMVDPLVSFHSLPENDNGAIDVLVKEGFAQIARETKAASELFHHPGKPKLGQSETTVEDSRGASSLLWAVRSARVLNFMTPAEAERLGIADDDRRSYVRIANGKANAAPVGAAKWMRIVAENLPNGDQVACATFWEPPKPFDGISIEDLKVAQKLAQGGAYRASSQSPQWFGFPLAEHLGINVRPHAENTKSDVAKLNSIIKTWIKNNALAVEMREDESRHQREFIVPGPAVADGRKDQWSDDGDALPQ